MLWCDRARGVTICPLLWCNRARGAVMCPLPWYTGCRQITKGSNLDVTTGGFLHDVGKKQKGMDMPSKRIKWKVHRIFFERSGGNQQPRQVFRGLPRSTGLLVA